MPCMLESRQQYFLCVYGPVVFCLRQYSNPLEIEATNTR